MAALKYDIEILDAEDNRLNEIAIKVNIKNNASNKYTVLSLSPNIPEDVELETKVDSFQEESKREFEALCKDLSSIVNDALLLKNQKYQEDLALAFGGIVNNGLANVKTVYRRMLFGSKNIAEAIARRMIFYYRRDNELRYDIKSSEDAQYALDNIILQIDEGGVDRMVYEAKLKQLIAVPEIERIDPENVATIEPTSFYSRTYVLKFRRRFFSTRIYNISFDSTFSEEGDTKVIRENVSTSINITPNPVVLTVFAGLMSLFGAILKSCLDHQGEFANEIPWNKWFMGLQVHLIPSFIIAILFFNMYEFTDITKKMKVGVNARTALIIGTLSGVFGDKFLDIIKIVLGIK